MDTNDLNQQEKVNPLLEDQFTLKLMKETQSWTLFLSIVGFVLSGLMVLITLIVVIFGGFSSASGGDLALFGWTSGFSLIYLLGAALYFYPSLKLYQYSNHLRIAFQQKSEADLINSFEKIKSFFKFTGILTAIFLGFYTIGLIAVLLFSAF